MKNFRPRSLTLLHAALIMVSTLTFLGLFSMSRSSAQVHDGYVPARVRSEALFGPFDYDAYLERERNGEFPFDGGDVPPVSPDNSLTNNNGGSTGTNAFTQSETAITAFGNNVVVAFNDSGSAAGGSNKFTGFARSTDGGATFTDGGTLPTNPTGDAGDPVLARNNSTGRIYLATLGFSGSGTIQVFRSDDSGTTWMAPVNGTPGGSSEDKEWIAVDNFAGPGNGNVYLVSRRFGGVAPGIYFFRSTDNGATFSPNLGTLLVAGMQGAFVAVGPDHSVYAFWWAGSTIQMRKSTDQGLTFGAPVTVATGLTGGTNGDLGLTGIRQGTATASGFRSNEFPHAAVNPANGNVYAVFNDNPAGVDKGDIFVVQSTDGGLTWGARVRVNDDATTTDQWQPTLAVTPDGSRLGIFYYSRQEDPVGNNLFKFYGRVADSSGPTLTFKPSFAISEVASLPEFGRDGLVNSVYMGDYDMAVGTPGAFHVLWADNRSDLPGGAPRKDPNVFYKKINLSLSVTSTIPAVASVISTQPTVFTVNVSEPIDPVSLQASDFTVNGIPATSVAYTAGSTTITFTFSTSPVTAQGLQTMNIAAGAFVSAAAGDPVTAFTGPFRYDVVLLTVTSTVPPVGGVFTLPSPFTYDVNFNEPVDPASVQTGDLQLSGITGSSVIGVTVLSGNTTARFTLSIPGEGTLTASIPAGAITDAFGNSCAAFSGSYLVDIATLPYPTPLLAKSPLGSLIYDPSVSGLIGSPGDTDSFTLNVDPGQTITAIVGAAGGLQARLDLRNPASTVIGSFIAAAPNQPVLLQTVPATTAGTYVFTVSGAGGTTGNYAMVVYLNAAREAEGVIAGVTNDTIATAQSIDPSFIGLQTSLASASRGAVLGSNPSGPPTAFQTFDFESGQQGFVINNGPLPARVAGLWHLSTRRSAEAGHSPTTSFYFGSEATGNYNVGATAGTIISAPIALPNIPGLGLAFNYVLRTEGNGAFDVASVQVSNNGGATFTTIASSTSAASLPLSATWRSASFSLAAFAGQTVLIRFSFDTVDNVSNAFEGWYVDDVQLTSPGGWNDYYSFSASASDVVSVAMKNVVGTNTNVSLEDGTGTVLVTGVSGPTNYDKAVGNFTVPTAGTYLLHVTGTIPATYDLVVTRNAAFDTEGNDTAATAQNLSRQWARSATSSAAWHQSLSRTSTTARFPVTHSPVRTMLA